MRYLVTARLRPGKKKALAQAVERRTLGSGSVAGSEYLRDMKSARLLDDRTVKWIETCFCPTPLAEERPYWGGVFPAGQGAGCPRAQPLSRSGRVRALGLYRLRLLGPT